MLSDVNQPVPGKWAATNQARVGVDIDWVKRFNDNALSQFVDEALSSNYEMSIAAERVARAYEAARVEGALTKPQLTLSSNADRRKTRFIGFPFGGSTLSESYGVDLKVDWELDVWGRARAGKSAAIAEWQAGSLDYRAARASLAAQVCKAWFALAEANQQVSLARRALRTREQTEDAVRGRFQRDMQEEGGSASQLRLSQTDVATAKAELANRQGNQDNARRQLELLMGRYPAARLLGRVALPAVASTPPSGLPSELLLRRPDIMAAERRYAAKVKRIKEAQLAIFPSFTITGSTGTTTEALSNIVNSDFGVWSVGANLLQPLLTGGRVRGEIRARKSSQREALAALHQTVLSAFGEVEQALSGELWLRRREREMLEARDLARDAAQAAEDDYREGNGNVLTLFVAETRKIQLESQSVALRRLRLNNRIDLHLALGGGFEVNDQ
ncbi:MAG: efflux transporter outer membrane subunit [Akkermansiaceae bacterium]|nr:efflux transporter outer membrane subunit [Akkermansiaceae bacterium]